VESPRLKRQSVYPGAHAQHLLRGADRFRREWHRQQFPEVVLGQKSNRVVE
jgi:hypothetical protein